MSEDVKTGIYRHYKNKEYRVLYTAIDTETKEEMVVYQAMYGEGKIWVRPKKMFLEEVEADGQKKSRFEFISEDDYDWQNKSSDAKSSEDKYKRALADYQNLLKQTAKEKMEFAVYANENMLREILPVYDNLKMAMEHHNGESSDDWLKGVEHVVKQFKDVLEKIGVEEILVPTDSSDDSVGIPIKNIGTSGKAKDKKFDHNLMDAIQSEETEDKKLDGQVAKQVKAGYKLNGKVIEPAKVIVYKMK